MAETGPIVSFVDGDGKVVFLTADGKLHKKNPYSAGLTAKQIGSDIKRILPDSVKQDMGFIKPKKPQQKF